MIGDHTPIFLQQNEAECGLACLAMTAAAYDPRTTLEAIRARYPTSFRGNTLAQLADIATDMGFVARGLRSSPEQLANVKLPAIAHWNLDHFVLITQITRRGITVVDPSCGIRRLSHAELSDHFTGYVLELQPGVELNVPVGTHPPSSFQLLRSIVGLSSHLRSLVGVGLLIELLGLSSPLLVQIGVDTAIQSSNHWRLMVLVSAFLVLTGVQSLTSAGREIATSRLSASVSQLMSLSAFRTVMRWSYIDIASRSTGDVLSRFGSLDNVRSALINTTVQLSLDAVMVTLALVLLTLYSPLFGLLAAIVLGAYALMRRSYVQQQMSYDSASVQHIARQQTVLVETLRAAHVIKAYSAENVRQAAYDAAVSPAVFYQSRSQRLAGLIRAGWLAAAGAQSVLVVAVAMHLVQSEVLTIGMLYAVIAINTLLLQRGGSAIELLNQLAVLRVHVERASQILRPSASSPPLTPSRANEGGPLVVDHVSFRYSSNDPFVLRQVSFQVEPGQVVAITGASGCGKSTLLKIVAGMLDPLEGSVTLGGNPISPKSLGLVLQDDLLLSGSILDNITFFSPEPDAIWAEECARMASIFDDIERMPMRIHTRVGESGSALSGGQRQRVMLARALYRRPAILVLDEATSHLDAVNEAHIVSTLRQLGIMIVQAAHRKETLDGADVLIRLTNQGEIVHIHASETT